MQMSAHPSRRNLSCQKDKAQHERWPGNQQPNIRTRGNHGAAICGNVCCVSEVRQWCSERREEYKGCYVRQDRKVHEDSSLGEIRRPASFIRVTSEIGQRIPALSADDVPFWNSFSFEHGYLLMLTLIDLYGRGASHSAKKARHDAGLLVFGLVAAKPRMPPLVKSTRWLSRSSCSGSNCRCEP